jgi:hypothetical protein
MEEREKKGDLGSKLRKKEGSQNMRRLGKEKERRKKRRMYMGNGGKVTKDELQ